MELEGIDHVALSVRDVERSSQWYIDVLGFERRHQGMWDGVPVFIGKGTTSLALFPVNENWSAKGRIRRGEYHPSAATSACFISRCARIGKTFSALKKN